jgi:CRP-like cAMP-binding protein
LASLLIGALVFGYLLSSVGSMMSTLDNRANMVEMKLDMAQEVIRHTNLPSALASRIRSYTEYYYSRQSVYDVQEVLGHLTPALDREVKECMLNSTVNTWPLLRVFEPPFKLDVMSRLRPVMLEVDESVISKGCFSDELFFLRRGEVRALASEGSELYEISEPGRLFGEHVLLRRSCPTHLIAFTRCELHVLSAKALAEAVCRHLSAQERDHLAREVLNECTRKMKMRYLALRIKLVRLREAKVANTKRTCAALSIQTYQIRRLASKHFYRASNFEETLWATAAGGGVEPDDGGTAAMDMDAVTRAAAVRGATTAGAAGGGGGRQSSGVRPPRKPLHSSDGGKSPDGTASARARFSRLDGWASQRNGQRTFGKSRGVGHETTSASSDRHGNDGSTAREGGASSDPDAVAALSRRVADLSQSLSRVEETVQQQAAATRQIGVEMRASHQAILARLRSLEPSTLLNA